MFNLQGSELIIILLLALVVLGPEKLPDAMRKAGQFYAELKKMSSSFQQEFRSVIDEPVREMRDTANLLRDSADFRQLQAGERDEKPKSAEMVAAATPGVAPVEETPSFESSEHRVEAGIVEGGDVEGGDVETDSAEVAREPVEPTPIPPPPPPFSSSQASSASPPRRAPESGRPGDGADPPAEPAPASVPPADDASSEARPGGRPVGEGSAE